ncbi:MAG: DUF3179 domain-containing protein [Alphaproteobacteria bacterium]
MLIVPLLSSNRLLKVGFGAGILLLLLIVFMPGLGGVARWKFEWPDTDFSRHSIDFAEIRSGGPPKDGIPSIDDPRFVRIAEANIKDTEPVISVNINGEAKAYPLTILMFHEIVNDELGGVPISVTYCPLCNSAIVFDRRVGERVLDFGTTGKLRNSDLVMYDRQTESWWQQFIGEAIVGEMTGTKLKMLPVRVEAFGRYKQRLPHGLVQRPPRSFTRSYGTNPYSGYDSSRRPFLYNGPMPDGIAPLAYVVAVGGEAWSLDLLRRERRIETGDLVITWEPGQNSALDKRVIAEGRDIGNVIVQRREGEQFVDEVHDLTFAFAFHAFHPEGVIHQ